MSSESFEYGKGLVMYILHYCQKIQSIWNALSNRVATAQGKQGIWLLTFPDRENTGNLVNLIFYTGELYQHRKNFENLEFFENFGDVPQPQSLSLSLSQF